MIKKEADRLANVFQQYTDASAKTEQGDLYINALLMEIKAIDGALEAGECSQLELARLLVARIETSYKLYNKDKVYQEYVKRLAEYKPEYERLIIECEECYDDIYKQAEMIVKFYPSLLYGMMQYKNPENDMKYKTEYYLFLKHHVDEHGKNKSKMKVVK